MGCTLEVDWYWYWPWYVMGGVSDFFNRETVTAFFLRGALPNMGFKLQEYIIWMNPASSQSIDVQKSSHRKEKSRLEE